jgi:putative aldouronate transport system substrate-binding protein
LKAFKQNDLNGNGKADEIPLSFLYVEGSNINREVKRDHRPFYYAFGSLDTPFYININDKDEVFFTATQNEWKEATKYLHKLYAEGLIDKEVFTQDRTLLTQKLRTQKNVGCYTDYRKDQSMTLPEDQDKYTFVPALKGPNGTQTWARAEVSIKEGSFAITSAVENPEILVRWIDHCNQEQYTPQMAYGMFKPAGYTEAEALIPSEKSPGKYEVNNALRPKDVDPTEWFMTSPIAQGCTLLTKKTMDEYVAEKASSVAKLNACKVYTNYLSKWPYNYPYKFSTEEVDELSLLQADIASYVDKTAAKWIVDGGIDEEWNDFLAQLDKLGVDRYLELYKTAFERVEGK